MPDRRSAAFLTVSLLLTGCSAGDRSTPPAPGRDLSLAAYWQEHPDLAPDVAREGTVVLDEVHTGSSVFELPDVSGYESLTVGISCSDLEGGASWIAGFGTATQVWPAQVASGCGGAGANVGTYPTAQIGAPSRLHVLVDDGLRYSVAVWGHTPPVRIG
ncbi:hypothetical protein NUM3379_37630 [Kineococcus sp. NUM-3379]